MLYLYGDESNTPGEDKVWAVGFLFSVNPSVHMRSVEKIRKECSYEFRELKYSSTDYSQILCGVRLIDYFLMIEDLFFKIIVKDKLHFDKKYFSDNHYQLDEKDMTYVSAYSELSRTISPTNYNQSKKLLNIDDKGFKGNVILPTYLKNRESDTITQVFRRNSKRRRRDGHFTGVSNMIQLADFLTGIILSYADKFREKSKKAEKHKNIYRKALLSKCKSIQNKLNQKASYYWPSFSYQKVNVFYWKQKASLSKSPSRS